MQVLPPIPCKSLFKTGNWAAYLDSAAEGLPLQSSGGALAKYFSDKSLGSLGRPSMFEAEGDTARLAAGMLGTSEQNVAFTGNATDALNLLGNSIQWRRGDRILITDLEFSSNVVCWLRLREQGVKVEVIKSSHGIVELEQFTSRLSSSTRLVSVSQVSYKTGTQFPYLRELSREVHRAGALFVVDATQALGRVPVSVDGVDFLVASSYKWLLGVHGLGLVYCDPALLVELKPGAAGWYSITDAFAPDRFEEFTLRRGAARFIGGMPNFPSLYVMRESLDLLTQMGVERIDTYLKPLVRKLREGIASLGFRVLTPSEEAYASGIVSFSHDASEELGQALRDQGVIVWTGDGRVRASVHLYNDEADVETLLSCLENVQKLVGSLN